MKSLLALALAVTLTSGCASYQSKIDKPFHLILNHDPLAAIDILKPKSEEEGNDQLVYLLEYGIALHQAGKLQESTNALLKAYDMVEIKDYHSLSKIAGSLLLNETVIQYKGEDFEKVLVDVYLAINYLLMGKLEDAAVEARRVNEILYKFKNEAKRDYTQNPFARYLSAIIWENDRKWDDMYIDYKNTYDLVPSFKPLQEDLLWGSKRARRPDDFKKWKDLFPTISYDKYRDENNMGELVFIYQQGLGPQKRPDPGFPRIPHLYPRYTEGVRAQIVLVPEEATILERTNRGGGNDKPQLAGEDSDFKFKTERIFSITDTALKTLNDQYAAMIAKKIGGIATKAIVADQIAQKNKALGQIAWIAMNIADQADLRQWATLPESFQIARRFLKPGKYKVQVHALNSSGTPSGEHMPEQIVEVQARKKVFMTWRSFK